MSAERLETGKKILRRKAINAATKKNVGQEFYPKQQGGHTLEQQPNETLTQASIKFLNQYRGLIISGLSLAFATALTMRLVSRKLDGNTALSEEIGVRVFSLSFIYGVTDYLQQLRTSRNSRDNLDPAPPLSA